MKSLLVDALRKAQDEPADNPTGNLSEVAEGDSLDESSGEVDDVSLFESSAADRPREIDDLSLFETRAVVVDEGIVAQNDDLINDNPMADTLSEQSSSLPVDQENQSKLSGVPHFSTDQYPDLPVRHSIAGMAARATPAICVIALFSAATARFLVDAHFTGSISENMLEMSVRTRPETDALQTGKGERDLPIEKINVFNHSAAVAAVDRGSPAQPVSVHAAPIRRSPVVPDHPMVPDRNAFQIDSSSANTGVPNDRAFELVVAGYEDYRANDYESAESRFGDALSIEPNHRDGLVGLAAVYQKTDRNNLALLEYEKILAMDPGDTLAASALLALRAAQTDAGSESELKHLIQRFPDAHHLHYTLGLVYVGEQRWVDARHAFRLAYGLAPDIADYSYNLAVSMERLGESRTARHYYEVAVAVADGESNFDVAAVKSHLTELKDGVGESS